MSEVVIEKDGRETVVERNIVINQITGVDQIPADWNQTDNTKPDFIKNKPTIPGAPVWGEIGGDIADQSDLVAEFAKKMDVKPTVLPEETDIDTVVDNGKYSIGSMVVSVTSIENGTVYQEVLLDEYISQFRSGNNGEWNDWVVYVSATSIDNLHRAIADSIGDLADTVNNKVDKVPGKGLSTNDYTDTEKTKLGSAVTSSDIAEIVALTQSEYNAITPAATSLYIITGA